MGLDANKDSHRTAGDQPKQIKAASIEAGKLLEPVRVGRRRRQAITASLVDLPLLSLVRSTKTGEVK
jgi:hypothetical protein